MPQIQQAPINDPMIERESGKPRLSWILFFQSLITGDIGASTAWVPVATNLTTVGTPTITGNYYSNQGFTDFWIKIVPGTSTTSTSGTTYFDLPFDVTIDGGCFAVTGNASSVGATEAATNRVYPASWSAITTPITISGRAVS